MTVHEQFADDLARQALGSLEGEERKTLEKHLEECASCRRELEQLRGDMALMALSAAGAKPPERARTRLLEAIRREPRLARAPVHRSWWSLVPWTMALAGAVIVVLLLRQNGELRQSLATLQGQFSTEQIQLEQAKQIVETLTAPASQKFTLVAGKTPPQPQGKAFYLRNQGRLVFLANNLPSLPPHKAYELWLIPAAGAPIPAGVFKPDAHGSATVVNPPVPAGVEAKAFAITVEGEEGASTPTMPIVMMGAGL